jgi:dihydropteroate synthase
MRHTLQFGRYNFPLGDPAQLPLVMGILNITPDSFSDGGQFHSLDLALSRAEQMIADGVDIIDIGGESSRPGAPAVPLQQELDRVMPVLYALRDCGKPISIDTCKPAVMREAIAAGVDMINDINGLRAPGALEAVQGSDCALCIMHMQNMPSRMQEQPEYVDVVRQVIDFLQQRVEVLTASGIDRQRLCIDPGFGFGKTVQHNFALLKALAQIRVALNLPLLAGLSRKSMLGAVTGKPVEQRLAGSLAGILVAVEHGADIVRVHDVSESVDALKVWRAAH